jgi:hypothetical protein
VRLEDYQLQETGSYTIVLAATWAYNTAPTGSYDLSLTKIPSTLPLGIYNPSPANGATVANLNQSFRWDAVAGATGYDLYFGEDVIAPLERIGANLSSPEMPFPPMERYKVYYWHVEAHLPTRTIQGPYWWFKTLAGSISGKVTYTCNTTGIAGATVNLTQGGSMIDSTTTDGDGNYTFVGVAPGVYSVNASKLRFWDNATEVTVTAGAPIEADMMLWLKGDLYNDGVLDIYDIIMLRQAAAENIPWDYRYDLYVDAMVDIYDIIVLRQAVAGNVVLE